MLFIFAAVAMAKNVTCATALMGVRFIAFAQLAPPLETQAGPGGDGGDGGCEQYDCGGCFGDGWG